MLPGIADQQNPVLGMETAHEVMHLLGRSKRAFVEHIEPLAAGILLLFTGKMGLQS